MQKKKTGKEQGMKLRKQALLYDIANMAYVIADTSEGERHLLHQVRDVCEKGNIDRVARVLGLAYAKILAVLLPIIEPPHINIDRDQSAEVHDYPVFFRNDRQLRYKLTAEKKLKIKELIHEFMVCMVLADWLGITMPECADVWTDRFERALSGLKETVAEVMRSGNQAFRRKVQPI